MAAPPIERCRLGLRLGAGALAFVVAAALFATIAVDVAHGDRLIALDHDVAAWLHRHATPSMTAWMMAITDLNSTFAVSCYAAAIALHQAWRRHWRRVATVVLCVGGVLAVNVLMKLAFHRARPAFDDPLLTLSTYSFPSGHVAGSTALYGLFVAWVFGRTQRLPWRLLAVIGALAAIALVALSRMYLGVHYLSDVAAAFAEGVAWLALCLGALAAFWRHDRRSDVAAPADTPG